MSTITEWGPFLRVEEAARLLRISRTSAYALTRRFLETDGREGLARRCGSVVRCGCQPRRSTVSPTSASAMMREGVVVGAGTRNVAAQVGPTSWLVLERLMVLADAEMVAAASVRMVAADVGLAKDTVAAAVRRLRVAGLVVPAAARFEPARYRLHVSVDVLHVAAPRPVVDARVRRVRCASEPSEHYQLGLLDGA